MPTEPGINEIRLSASEASSEVEGLALFSNFDEELLRKWRIRA